jgi:hypothetical protein
LQENEFAGNLTADLFAGFTRFGITSTYKPLHDGRIDTLSDQPLSLRYDVPQCDPFEPEHKSVNDKMSASGLVVAQNAPFCVP